MNQLNKSLLKQDNLTYNYKGEYDIEIGMLGTQVSPSLKVHEDDMKEVSSTKYHPLVSRTVWRIKETKDMKR